MRKRKIHGQNGRATAKINFWRAENSATLALLLVLQNGKVGALKTCVILNPVAGSVSELETLKEKFQRLAPKRIFVTKEEDDARKFAQRACDDGFETIVAAGGDGTLNEIVNGIAECTRAVRIGLVPLGTGNDFARSHDLPKSVDDCIELVAQGRCKALDVVRVTSDRVRYFVNVSAGGFSGIVDEKLTPEIKKTWGPLAYFRCAAAAWPELRAYETTLTLDDSEQIMMRLYNVIVGNGRFVAGGMAVAPEAILDDGQLDLILIPEQSTAELAVLAAQLLLGKHLTNEKVVYRRARKVSVRSRPGMWFNVDGELVGNEPAVFEVLPRRLQFIVGQT